MGMARIFFIVLAILWIFPANGALASGCQRPVGRLGKIDVQITDASVRYDFSKSRDELQHMGSKALQGGSSAFSHVTGLTQARLGYDLEGQFLMVRQPGLGLCIWPERIKLRIGYDPMTVYVDKRYRQGTCQNTAVLQHEHEHVRINQNTFRRYVPYIKSFLEQAAVDEFPVIAKTEEEARSKGLAAFSQSLNGLMLQMETERDSQHARLDSRESYERTRKMCQDW